MSTFYSFQHNKNEKSFLSFISAFSQCVHKTFSQRGKIQMDGLESIVNLLYGLLPFAELNIFVC